MVTFLAASAPAPVGPSATAVFHRSVGTISVVGANQSSNWSGYNLGTFGNGNGGYRSISGTWVVPKATQSLKGEAEYSSTWVGIGGGCVDSGCTATDSTLIQAGTEQDVNASGKASYFAWWEIIPEPETPVSLAVKSGDTVTVTINEVLPDQWTIKISNVSTGRSVTVNTPYTSTHATAEWIEESPLIIGFAGGFAALPSLSTVHFDSGQVNGMTPSLDAKTELIHQVNGSGQVIAQPSLPDSDKDGFNDCTWATTCATPSS